MATPPKGSKPFQEYPKMVYHLAYPFDGIYQIVQNSDEQRALGPEWFERPGDASVAFDQKPQRKQLEILSGSKNSAVAIDRFYNRLFDSAPGKEKLQVVGEYRDEYPHLAVNSEWAKPYLAHLSPVESPRRADSESGNQEQNAIASARRTRKEYPKGFDGLQEKHADMSGYLAMVDLTRRQRECFSLRKEYNLSLSEVAGRLGIDRKTAYEHIHQAEKKMQLQLGKRRDHSGRIKIAPTTD